MDNQRQAADETKIGRPQKELTQKQIHQMEALAAFGYSQQIICDFISKDEKGPIVAERTFARIKQRNPEVLAAYQKGIEGLEERAVKRLLEHMDDKINAAVSLKATRFVLEAQCNWSTIPKEDKKSLEDDVCNLNINERVRND